jgi:putative ABC transport system ATP-binding protein
MLAYSVAIGVLSLVVPVATQSMVNTIAFGTILQPLIILGLVVLIALGFSSVLRAMRTWVVEIIQRRVFVRVVSDAVHRLLRVRIEAFDSGHGPELVNRFFEVVTVQKAGAILLVDGLAIFIQTVVGLFLLAFYHPLLLAFGVLILVSILLILIPLGAGAIPTAINESKAKYAMAAWLEELARFPATFKSSSGAAFALEKANELTGEYLKYRTKHFRVLFRQIIGSYALETIASAVLLAAGGWLVIQRQLTLGQLVASELILALVVSGFAKFGKQLETFYDLLAAVDKLGYLTDLPLESRGEARLTQTGPAALHFRNVSFSYEHSAVLNGVSLAIPAGSRVSITGVGGEGKSTLLDLLYALRTPTAGVIEIDQHDYRDLALDCLRSQIELVRNVEIFQGTLAENVSLGDANVNINDIRNALEQVGLLNDVLDLPEGMHTVLSTGGQPLSQSQGVRLMFARALVHRPRLLLVDEALDKMVETSHGRAFCDSLIAHRNQWTLILATRNPDLAAQCDLHYELRGGQLEPALRVEEVNR